jgi:type VI secretion system protein ImpG
MNTTFLNHYERELRHLREGGAEFAKEFPKIAGRLGIETFTCADPYVERLLEGFAFLAARVQYQIDAEYPRLIEHLLETIYPQYLSPTPSMAMVQLRPDLTEAALASGFVVPRQTPLLGNLSRDGQTRCEYRTAHDVKLFPLELTDASYVKFAGAATALAPHIAARTKSVLTIELKTTASLKFSELNLDVLNLYLRGDDGIPGKLLEQVLGKLVGVQVRTGESAAAEVFNLPCEAVKHSGLSREQALLPDCPRAFEGYRLLHEYFAFPDRLMFLDVCGLKSCVRANHSGAMAIQFFLAEHDSSLERSIHVTNFALNCSPAINLFPKRADRIQLDSQHSEFHLVIDRTRPLDFEVFAVESVVGSGVGLDSKQDFLSLYQSNDAVDPPGKSGYYHCRRGRRVGSERERRVGARSSYIGCELFLSLVDSEGELFEHELRQLSVDTLCTNRDLPLSMPIGVPDGDFALESSAPVLGVSCLAGPTAPRASFVEGEVGWRLVSHLTLNYLSLVDDDTGRGVEALRELLRLYVDPYDESSLKQIDGVVAIDSEPIVRRMPGPGPVSFGRGLQVTVIIDDANFEGLSPILLGSVLNQFFSKYVSLNSFVETRLKSSKRGLIKTWIAESGRCKIL